jgi:hypothetical protein
MGLQVCPSVCLTLTYGRQQELGAGRRQRLKKKFTPTVQNRGAQIIAARGASAGEATDTAQHTSTHTDTTHIHTLPHSFIHSLTH